MTLSNFRIIADYTKYISPFFRRMDTISRFLEVDQTCAAVCLINNELLVSTNKLKIGTKKSTHNFQSLKEGIKLLNRFVDNQFQSSNIFTAYYRIYGSYIQKPDIETLTAWCNCLEKEKQNLAKYNLKILDTKYDYKQLYKNYEYIKAVKFFLEELYPDKIEVLNLRNKHKKTLKLMHENLQKMHARAYQDAHKIVELMTTDKFPELKQALQNFEDGARHLEGLGETERSWDRKPFRQNYATANTEISHPLAGDSK